MSEFNQGLFLGMFVGVVCGMFIMCLLCIERTKTCLSKTKQRMQL